MDRLDSMSILLAVVEAGSLSAAGRRLGMPLATVSRRVCDLEGHLKTRLLARTSRQLALTDAGRSYVAACRRILEEVEEAERAAAGEYSAPKGELIMTAPIVFGRLHVLPVVAEFLETYPEINVRIVFADHVLHLMEDHIDLAVRIGALPDSSMLARSVGSIRRVVCASPAYYAARGKPTVPEELASHDCVAFEGLTSSRSWIFPAAGRDLTVPIRARLVVNTAEAAIDAAAAGVGITRVLSYQVAERVREGALEVALRDFEPEPSPVSLVHAGQGHPPLKLRAFIDFAAPRIRARLIAAGS
jgi:DNA-binding transcriptional LysR family regulator